MHSRTAHRLLGVLFGCLLAGQSLAFDSFRIDRIEARGLQRLELGTILDYLPISEGDSITESGARNAIRALYTTGLFNDVSLWRDGNTLVVGIKERPAIAGFEIEGNKKIGGDDLDKALTEAGLAEGRLFRRSLLDQIEQEMRRQYYANGYYDVDITASVEELPNNRVDLKIDVVEGSVARIRRVNIVGNEAFDDETLRDSFKMDETRALSFFQRSDRYSKQQLVGDLEGLSSYYQDRGYLRFAVSSVQVALSPQKRDIFVTINVDEGRQYNVKEFNFVGDLILEERYLRALVSIRPGDTFSRKQATESANRMSSALSNVGYAFAEVEPLTRVDEESGDVVINFAVNPGKRAYVRNVSFSGHVKTNDETLRREMRQLEGATFSRSAVERSRTRLARLPFISDVTVDTERVPGTEDLVDVNFDVTERPPGSVQFGVGFSGSQGFLITGSITHTNFFGTGNRVSAEIQHNQVAESLSFSWTDPYFTDDGISRTVSAFFRKSEQVIRFSSGFDSNAVGAATTFGFPISEFSSVRLGVGFDNTAINTFPESTADEVLAFVLEHGTKFTNYELRTGFSRDTRNRTIFANRGSAHRISLDIQLPGSDLQFYRGQYSFQQYLPVWKKVFLEVDASVGMADSYSGKGDLPPYEHFFAGGSNSVRGFRDGSLGPRDTPFNNPYGGKFRTVIQNELVIPLPFKSDGRSTRFSLFYDIGNVFAEPEQFSASELRSSTGVAFQWFTPFLGVLRLSYALPLETQVGDREDKFQITFGPGF